MHYALMGKHAILVVWGFTKEQHLDWLSWNENKGDWTSCGDFKELGKIDDYDKLCRKFFTKCIAACSAIMIVYAIFVIPLVLMLFK